MASKYLTYTFHMLMPPALLLAPYAAKREKIVRNTVVFTSLVLMTALFTYIVPMTHRDSSEDQVPFLQSLVTENTLLFLYVLRYPASVAYYSRYKVEHLEMKDDIEAKRPQGMTWNDTKVMPFYAGEDLPDDRDILDYI